MQRNPGGTAARRRTGARRATHLRGTPIEVAHTPRAPVERIGPSPSLPNCPARGHRVNGGPLCRRKRSATPIIDTAPTHLEIGACEGKEEAGRRPHIDHICRPGRNVAVGCLALFDGISNCQATVPNGYPTSRRG